MEPQAEYLDGIIENVSKLIFDVDDVQAGNKTQTELKEKIMAQLQDARVCLREGLDAMEFFLRRG